MKQAILIVLAVLCLRTVTYGQAVTVTASAIKPNPNVAAPSGACPRRNAVLIDASTIYVCPESGAQNWTAVSGGGGGGVTIGTTTITGGTNTRVLYNNSGVFGSAPINVNALNSTYLDITSAASGSGLTLTVAGGGTNETLFIKSKGSTGAVVFGNTATNAVGAADVEIKSRSTSNYPLRTIRSSAAQTLYGVYEESDGSASLYMTNQIGTTTAVIATNLDSYITGGRFGIGTNTPTAAQLQVLSGSTTRPAARFQAASGASGSQEMVGIYDGSGALAASFSANGTTTVAALKPLTHNTYDIGVEGSLAFRRAHFSDYITAVSGFFNVSSGNSAGYQFETATKNFLMSAAGGEFFLKAGGLTSSFPALKRSGAGLQARLADDTAFTTFETSNLTANGWLWAKGSDPSVYLGGSSDASIKRVAPKVIAIMDGNAAAGTVRAVPDSPTQLTADQNNYQAGTGRSLFYRLSSDASRTITGFNPAGGTNQDGELHYFINVGANNIVLANESASSTAANRFTNVTGADITLAANEIAMLVYDNTSARWRVAKM